MNPNATNTWGSGQHYPSAGQPPASPPPATPEGDRLANKLQCAIYVRLLKMLLGKEIEIADLEPETVASLKAYVATLKNVNDTLDALAAENAALKERVRRADALAAAAREAVQWNNDCYNDCDDWPRYVHELDAALTAYRQGASDG